MTVSTVVDHNDYTGNGVTTSFPYTFRIFKKTDLTVSVIDLSENITVLVLETDYTVTNAGGYNGGNVVLTTPLATGWKISVSRELEPTQETDLRNQGKFFAEVHEDAFDKLTMLIQQVGTMFSLALRKPASIANWYDALNNYIRNLKDPRDPQDAATKNFVDSQINRTLRVPEPINQLPNVAGRRNMMPAFDNEGNAIVVTPLSGSASDVLIQLASTEDGKGDALVAVKQPFIGSVARTQHDKNKDVINVKDFGAIGDGLDHPLSEKFSTLSAAQMVYPFVTSLTQSQDYAGIQAAINTAKGLNAAVFKPSGKYVVNTGLVADYALSMYGEGSGGLRDIASSGHSPSPVRGSVIMSKVVSGRTLSIVGTPGYSFGMTLRDFAIWGVEGQCDVGLYTHNVGWTGIIDGINIQRFPNEAWEIGYIQDTYVNNCSFLYSGSKDKPAVHCPNYDTNYLYFDGCHFECTPYMIGFDDIWFLSFNKCHFEVARPINGSADDRYVYQTSPIRLGATTRQVQFSNNTFIPTDVGFLASKLGVARNQIPYFISGDGNIISFTGDIFMAPEGSVNAAYLSGSGISFSGVKFIRMSPSKEFLHIGSGHVSDCTFGIDAAADTTKLYGVYVGDGSVIGNYFGFYGADSGGKRPEGGLLFGGAFAQGNKYPDDSRINIFLDSTIRVDGYDGGDARYITITASATVDLTKVHPSTHYEINGNSVAITNIFGAQLGRDLIVRIAGGTGSGVKYVAGAVETQGGVDWGPGASRAAQFKCIRGSAGKVMYQL